MQSSPSSASSTVPAALLNLAPLRLPNHRQVRYVADDLCVRLEQLAGRDQTLLRDLYKKLSALLFTLADTGTDDAGKWEGVSRWIDRHNLDRLIDEVRELGLASQERDNSEMLSMTLHDVRGGALSSLLGRLQLFGYLRVLPEALNVLFVQTRDHLKIMRSAVVGLDEERRNADRTPKAHAMDLILSKWHGSTVGPNWRERSIRMEIDCHYEGPLTECCLESAAIDRIFYNLADNAARYAADDRLKMVVFPLPEPPGECLRFVLSNRVNAEDAGRLSSSPEAGGADSAHLGNGQSLFALFEPEELPGGSGLGLAVVADFVAGAFGLGDRHEALRQRYVGAILDGQTFRVWFHWPMGHEGLPQKLDDYHQPEQSLSEP